MQPTSEAAGSQSGPPRSALVLYINDPDTLRRVRAEGLAGVRTGGRAGGRAGGRVGVRAGGRVGGGCRSGSAQQHATDEFVMRRNTIIAKPSYHWRNSLIIRTAIAVVSCTSTINIYLRHILYVPQQEQVIPLFCITKY